MLDLVPDKIYHPIGGMNWDSNGISLSETECIDAVNVVISQHDVHARQGTSILGETEGVHPSEPVIEYKKYVDPISGTVLLAFCATTIYRFVAGVGWTDITNSLVFDVTQWSLTNGIDDNIGATIVAAGSTYARPNEGQSGGSSRVLIYFDRSVGTYGGMVALAQTVEYPIAEEDTNVDGPAVASIKVSTQGVGANDAASINYDPNFVAVEADTISFDTLLFGTLGVAGTVVYSIGGFDCYRIVPTNPLVIEYGDSSFIRVDGSGWSLKFLSDVVNGQSIYINYSYRVAASFKPTYVSFYHNSLILANTYEETIYHPWRLRYTQQGDITKTHFYYYQDVAIHDITPIIQMKVMETVSGSLVTDYLYIYKQNSIVRALYNKEFNINPGLEVPFLTFETAHSEGLEATRTVVSAQGVQFYMGLNDVYMFNGIERVSITFNRQTGSSRVKELIFGNLDLLTLNKCFAVYDELNQKYMLFVKTLSNLGTYPTDCFVYDMELQTWTRHTYPECSAAINIDITPANSIANLVGKIEDLVGNIEDLGGNPNKLVVLAMTQKSYIVDNSSLDKTEALYIRMYFDGDVGVAPRILEPRDTLFNGKMRWELIPSDPPTSGSASLLWDGTHWQASSGGLNVAVHPTGTGDKPPVDGWGVWYQFGIPTEITPTFAYDSWGVPFDSYIITRDFVGQSLHQQDRTSLVYLEGRQGSLEVSLNGNYSQNPSAFKTLQTLPLSGDYKRVSYCCDVTASWVRFMVKLKEGAKLRWLQVFSTLQEFTNN